MKGYCKECDCEIYDTDECLPDYPGIYECSVCGHPNTDDDMIIAQE